MTKTTESTITYKHSTVQKEDAMALSGIEWHQLSVLSNELRDLRASKPKEERNSEEKAIVRYLKTRVNYLENKKQQSRRAYEES